MTDEKPSNPKDALGAGRAPLSLVPAIAITEAALAHLEGALKYGAHNYRAIGVRSSIYVDAAVRHLQKWVNGRERDPKTSVHELGSVIACCAIILDAQMNGLLTDDRPPASPATIDALDATEARVKHLRELFKDKHPRHYTIADSKGLSFVPYYDPPLAQDDMRNDPSCQPDPEPWTPKFKVGDTVKRKHGHGEHCRVAAISFENWEYHVTWGPSSQYQGGWYFGDQLEPVK